MQKFVQNTLNKLNLFTLVILVLQTSFACSPQKKFSSSPVFNDPKDDGVQDEQTYADSEPVTGLGLSIPPTRVFSIQNANTTLPEDVVEEVYYSKFGGLGPCYDNYDEYPIVDGTPMEADWLEKIIINVCGFDIGDEIDISIGTPSGETIKDRVVTTEYSRLFYTYTPSMDSQTGKYRFTFSGKKGNVQFDVTVSIPNGPRMYYLKDNNLYLYGLFPNERIRFFHYSYPGSFVGWQEYKVDKNGQLIIKLNQESDGYYIPVGDQSGEVPTDYSPWGGVDVVGVLQE